MQRLSPDCARAPRPRPEDPSDAGAVGCSTTGMKVRRSLPGAATALLLSALALSPARGDAVVVTQAMKASTIVEIFVERGSVRVEFEIGTSDVHAFRNAMPDAVYEHLTGEALPLAERWHRFLSEDFIVRADGKPLSAALPKIEARRRVPRDEITGEPLPIAETEPVIDLAFTYTLPTRPKTLTIRPPTEDGRVSASIGFVAYHDGIPATDFRYLGLEVTLDLDWEDPWYSQFRHRNLRRRFAAPLSAFLYVEPFEVRLEFVLRPKDLQHWVDLGLEGKRVIAAGEQAALKEKVVAFLRDKSPVTIDGKPAKLALDRVHFIRRTLRMTSVVDPPEDLPLLSATLGVIFYAPITRLPQEVTMAWDLWSPRIQTITAVATDEAGGLPSQLTPADPVLTWTNFLKNPTAFALTKIAPPIDPNFALPTLSAASALIAIGLAIFAVRRGRRRMLAVAAGMVAAAALAWPHARVTIPNPFAGPIAITTDTDAVVAGLLNNVYRSFDRREESVVYDRLARSITGDLLETVYLHVRRGTELANQGGARVKVQQVDLVALAARPSEDGNGFLGECTWNVSGSVGHWGHVHTRTNQYRAKLRVEPHEGVWKIAAMEVLEEARLADPSRR
ncbi:MAG: hypothetical protein V3T86_01010 [Planctomycetota bacterium]